MLTDTECRALGNLFDAGRFRSRMDMARHRFGDGRYRYFADHRWQVPAIIYVCGVHEACKRIERAGKRVGLYESTGHLRIETLGTIKMQTLAGYEQARTARDTGALATSVSNTGG